ncbi:MAG: hypothetical protein RL441_667 [Actinomycetota bacterium]|jgi:uncharacterized protein (TIGR00730 family)
MAAVCVYCSSSDAIDKKYIELAAELGAALVADGHSLVTGGGAVSMMGAIARSVRSHGGHTLGVIPQALLEFEVGDREADELVVTPDMRTRKAAMDNASDAFIALPGGIGTLEELLEVWTAASLAMHAKPVIVLDPFGDFAPLREMVDSLKHRGFVRPTALNVIEWTTTVEEAIRAIHRPAPEVFPLEHNEVRDV